MEYLQVRNWRKWQSYRNDRGQPPWIKLHRSLLRDPEWISLPDRCRAHLVSIWLLAADRDGQVPNDAKVLQRLCQLDAKPDLQRLQDDGFLTPVGCLSDAKMTPDGRQDDAPEEEKRKRRDRGRSKAETETDTERVPLHAGANGRAYDFDLFKNAYPERSGSNPWPKAAAAATARIKGGYSFDQLVDGARRYKRFCDATGKTGTTFVMQAQRFLGPGLEFENEWYLPDTRSQNEKMAAAVIEKIKEGRA